MIAAFIKFFTNLFGATAAVAGEVKQRDAENNSPAMQANAAAKTDAQISAKIAAAEAKAATGDLSEIEKLTAE